MSDQGRRDGEANRDEAMARAWRGLPDPCKVAMLDAVRFVAEQRSEMTTDPVWTVLKWRQVVIPKEHRGMGPVMQAALRLGWLEPTGRYHKSVLPWRNRRDLLIWRSLIVKQ